MDQDQTAQGEVLEALLDLNADNLEGGAWVRIADLMKRSGCSFEAFDRWVSSSGSIRYSGPEPLRAIWDGYPLTDNARMTLSELRQLAGRWAAHGEDDQNEVKNALYRETMRKLNTRGASEVIASLKAGERLQTTVPTGIKGLDKALGGGLRPGLAVLGAFSSLGKTSLCVQVADHIAASGRAVLFVSIEQTPRELVAKSLARIARRLTGRSSFASSDLYDSQTRASWATDGKQYADLAIASDKYERTIAPYLLYCGGSGQPSVAEIRAAAANICEHMGAGAESPVVIIDYLQLLAPYSERDSDKQTTDKHVTNLRQLSNDLNTPVVAISSISRAAYNGPVRMESFKESGSIEFGADLALGLQPLGMAERCKERGADAGEIIDETKRRPSRDLEIVVLKNRGYRMPAEPIPLYFDGASQSFTDRGAASATSGQSGRIVVG